MIFKKNLRFGGPEFPLLQMHLFAKNVRSINNQFALIVHERHIFRKNLTKLTKSRPWLIVCESKLYLIFPIMRKSGFESLRANADRPNRDG